MRVVLEDGREVALVLALEVGQFQCKGVLSSLGLFAASELRGFRSIEQNTLAVRFRDLPPGVPVVLLAGDSTGQKAFSGGSWCVGDNTLRIAQGTSDAQGHFTADLDLRDLSQRLGLAPGDQAFLQPHYLDPGGPFFVNLSSAMSLVLE